MCFSFIVATALFGLARLVGWDLNARPWPVYVSWAAVATYMALSLRRAYDDSGRIAVLKTLLVMVFGFGVSVILSFTSFGVALLVA